MLFRCGVLSQLEARRDELLTDRITQFQAACRGYLVRKKLAKRRVQELAVRCIQRNVRAFMTVRDWPWWRLLVRVTPLLNIHRTEEQLKMASDELQMLKSKIEKYEGERNALKTEKGRLELKVSAILILNIPRECDSHLLLEWSSNTDLEKFDSAESLGVITQAYQENRKKITQKFCETFQTFIIVVFDNRILQSCRLQ